MHAVSKTSSALLLLILPSLLSAGSIDVTDPSPTYAASASNCTGFGGPWQSCGATGYLSWGSSVSTTELFNFSGFNNSGGAGEERFLDSFNAWTNTAAGAGWTLVDGGQLDLDYHISQFETFAAPSSGGVNITIDIARQDGYTGPALNTLVWTQALAINYLVTDAAGVNHSPPVFSLDTFAFNLGGSAIPAGATCDNNGAGGKPYCDPAYPFQYADQHFFDGPTGVYPADSFRGIALLSSIDRATSTLTVYDTGVNYGFDLWVSPEPGTLFLIPAGLGAIFLLRKRRAS
jgi:hypothetical protein